MASTRPPGSSIGCGVSPAQLTQGRRGERDAEKACNLRTPVARATDEQATATSTSGLTGRLLFRERGSKIGSYDPSSQTSQQLAVSSLSEKGWLLRWSPDGHSIGYTIQPSHEGDPGAGLWVEDLHAKPRQVFHGWVTWYARGPGSDIFLLEGKPDLNGVLWTVGWDGTGLTRLATIPLVYSYWAGAKGLSQNYIDVSADGRRVIFGSLEVQQANIGMIENA